MIESPLFDPTVLPEFGEPGTDKWFGGVGAADFLTNEARRQDLPETWLHRNVSAAYERRLSLAPDHPFRSDDASLREILFLTTPVSTTDLPQV